MRLFLLFIGLAAIILVIFFIWGDPLLATFSQEGSVTWLNQYGSWAWVAAIILLMGDILLPLPATLIMSALGYLYGTLTGGLISVAGSFLAGSAGYWLCYAMGEKAAIRLLGQKDYARGKKLSDKVGGWVVALSRWLPVFPEVIACMAGLTRMPPGNFHLALLCGSLPLGFTYAFVGAAGIEQPVLAIVLSACFPPLIWWLVRTIFKKRLDV
ncbi:MAG TPA: VTT domain-containing protein [Chryseolinea sp.]|nr:VTT domain-containing protein [Chryseolinea sp.]